MIRDIWRERQEVKVRLLRYQAATQKQTYEWDEERDILKGEKQKKKTKEKQENHDSV